jgi:hypothetical protein
MMRLASPDPVAATARDWIAPDSAYQISILHWLDPKSAYEGPSHWSEAQPHRARTRQATMPSV